MQDSIQALARASQIDRTQEIIDNQGFGTAAFEDVGVGAGNVVQLDGSARLPAVDGSLLTNLVTPAAPVSSVFSRTGAVVAADGDYAYAANTLALPRAYLAGLGTTNNAGTPNTKLDVAVGASRDSTDAFNIVVSALKTIDCTTTGANGLDIGALGNSLWYYVYAIAKADNTAAALASQSPSITATTITVTIASPGVVTWTKHGLGIGAPVVFTTTGALPTGITAGTTYYVKVVPSADTLQIAATQGGSVINTSGSQSGVHTGTSSPAMPSGYLYRRRIGAFKTDASAHILAFYQNGDEFLWASPPFDVNNVSVTTTASLLTLSVPSVRVLANLNIFHNQQANTQAIYLSSPDQTDVAPAASTSAGQAAPLSTIGNSYQGSGSAAVLVTAQARVWTNASAQIRARSNAGTEKIGIATVSWMDRRGRDD